MNLQDYMEAINNNLATSFPGYFYVIEPRVKNYNNSVSFFKETAFSISDFELIGDNIDSEDDFTTINPESELSFCVIPVKKSEETQKENLIVEITDKFKKVLTLVCSEKDLNSKQLSQIEAVLNDILEILKMESDSGFKPEKWAYITLAENHINLVKSRYCRISEEVFLKI